MDKDVEYTHTHIHTHTYTMGYHSAIKKNKIKSLAVTWMDLEIIILNEVNPTEKDNTIWYHFYVESKKNDTNELIYKTERLTDFKNKLIVPKGKSWGWDKLGVWDWYIYTTIFKIDNLQFSSVQLLSHVQLFATPWTVAFQASLFITNSWSCSNSCPSSRRCNPTISSSVISFSSCFQYFPASGPCPMS